MVHGDPWYNAYLKHQNKVTVFCDFYISMRVDISSRFTSSSTDKSNANNTLELSFLDVEGSDEFSSSLWTWLTCYDFLEANGNIFDKRLNLQ